MMWGKHYASTYDGSMVGSGAAVFAVWGYVISKMQPDAEVGAQVELNPKLLAFVIGEPEPVISRAIERLCAPDKNSRTPERDGRRLVRLGQFAYQVVNGEKYLGLKNLDEKRAGDRERKQRQRSLKRGKPMVGEATYTKLLETEGQEAADAYLAGHNAQAEYMQRADLKIASKTPEIASARRVEEEPPKVNGEPPLDIPEIPLNEPDEPPTESGRMVDGEWIKD